MSIRKLRSGRTPTITAAEYVGQAGTIFWDEDTGALRLSDGVTPGGSSLATIIASATEVGGVKVGDSFTVSAQGLLSLNPATSTILGGIRTGPGVEVSDDGLLTIDAAGLPISFGDFFADGNNLSTVNNDQDLNLLSNGEGNINLVGKVNIYPTDGPIEDRDPVVRVGADGQVAIVVTNLDSNAGAVEIIGSTAGDIIAPGEAGSMLHITGQLDQQSRLYIDGNGNYVSFVARRWNGNVASPTQVLADQDILRFNATAATNAGVGNLACAQMRFVAAENQTTTAQGSRLEFLVTPIGTSASNRITVATMTAANGLSATKLTGPLYGVANLNAGNTTVAPLSFTAGTNLTSATAGTVEYDGVSFYATPSGAQRGVVPAEQWYLITENRSLTFSNTTPQNVFAVGPTLSANTRYYFKLKFCASRTTGDNNTALQLAWSGTATITSVCYTVESKTGVLTTVGAQSLVERVTTENFATPVSITAISNPPSTSMVIVYGFISVGNTGGTVNPMLTWAGATAAGAVTINAQSHYQLYPVSPSNGGMTIGNWV